MPMPAGLPVIDTMIGFPHVGVVQYDFIRKQTKDKESRGDSSSRRSTCSSTCRMKCAPRDPVGVTLGEMDRFNIEPA